MTKKIVKKYIYNGLGFPIELHNVEMVMFNGEFHPKIDVRKIADSAIKSLVSQETRLTGNQIKFIRTYFSMSLRDFSEIVNESHMAVKKWEDFKDKPTNMDRNIEILLRLYIYDHIAIKSKNDKKEIIKFYNQYLVLTKMFANQQTRKKLLLTSPNHPMPAF